MLPDISLDNLLPALNNIGLDAQLPEYAANEVEAVVVPDAVLGVLELHYQLPPQLPKLQRA